MKLDMEVGRGPGHIVLDRDPAPLPQRGTAPKFSAHVCCGQMVGQIRMPLGTEVGLLDGGPRVPDTRKKWHSPHFQPMSIVAKRLDGSRRNFAWR